MDIGSLLKTVAPWIGTALGGPLGGMAIEAAANAFGISEKTTDAVKAAITGATPEQMLALKKADQDFALQMQALGFKQVADLEAIAAGDRDSARKMQIAKPSIWPGTLSAITTAAVLLVILARMSGASLPSDAVTAQLIGSLTTGWGMCISYWFGTTRGSSEKNALLAQSMPSS